MPTYQPLSYLLCLCHSPGFYERRLGLLAHYLEVGVRRSLPGYKTFGPGEPV